MKKTGAVITTSSERTLAKDRKKKGKLWKITGVVTGHDEAPLRGARVVLWWQQIRERVELAAGETLEDGHYHLNYRLPKNAPQPVFLMVEALSEHLREPLLSSPTEAKPVLEINLSFEPRDQSEWAKLVRSLEPLIDDLRLSQLIENSTHQDISFLARELGRNPEVVMRVAVSARLEAAFKIPAPVFYAFLRQRVPSSLPSPLLDASQNFQLIDSLVHRIGSLIFGLSAQVQTQTLTSAIALDLIGPQFTKQIQKLVTELQTLHNNDLLTQPYLVGNATLTQLLDVATLPATKQQAFAQALATNTQSMRNFWRTLGDGQHGFTAEEASAIERTLSVGAFVKNHIPLVQNIVQGFAAGTYKSLSDLARLSLSDWVSLVNQTGPPSGINAAGTANPAQVFASVIYTRVTRAYPTVALSSRIAAGNFVKPDEQQSLIRFFQNNPNLELIKDNISAYIENQGSTAFAGIDQKDQATVVASVRSFQRVLRVAPNPDVTETLLGLGINSATKIAMMGQQQFFAKATAAGLTKPESNQVFRVAANRYASMVSTYTQLNYDSLGVWPQAMGDLSDLNQPVQQAIQRDQSLATLFGSQDYCATEDCTSILSPAAYLCDLLLWLRNHPQGANTVLDILDNRRPDVRHLLLNCPNTDIELPYIDLSNELLADKISPPTDPNSKINPIWKQTTEGMTAEQLRAAPEYFNQDAYVKLFGASYPQTLPYSAGLDELRTYLQHWNLALWQLRQALLPMGSASVDQQAAVAAERLGMNVQAERLVTASTTLTSAINATQASITVDSDMGFPSPNFYAYIGSEVLLVTAVGGVGNTTWTVVRGQLGSTAAAAASGAPVTIVAQAVAWNTANPPTDLAAVPAFLQAAHITYESLLELLEVSWVQGGLNITIQGINDLCDTSIQTLSPAPLDTGFLDRAHRFLRFWIATGYKMWELDLLLGAPSVGNSVLNQQALVALQTFWQLQRATDLAVDQLLAFYQNIDTSTHRDPDGTTTTSLYARIFLNPTVSWVARDPDLTNLAGGSDAVNTTLSAAITATQTSITVSSDIGFPAPNFYAYIGSEILLVTAVSGTGNTTWTVQRGQQGTTAAAAANGALLIPIGDPTLSDHLEAIQPALGVSAADVASLLALTNNLLSLDNLSLMYRVNALALASKFSISDLLKVAILLNPTAANPAAALVPLLASPAATLVFLTQAKNVKQQTGLSLDALTYLLTPPSASVTGGWNTSTQMTPAEIASALIAVQQEIGSLLSASTTLTSDITATQTSIAVASDVSFPAPNFYVYIGSEILLVTAVSGPGNTTWTVLRGQQGTTPAAAPSGTPVTPTLGDVNGAVISAVAANAHTPKNPPLSNDVTALILQNLQVPGTGQSLLTVLMDPTLIAATGTITIGGSPAAGDSLQAVLTDGIGHTVTVTYTLTSIDSGSINQTASDFAQAVNASAAVAGSTAFLAPCAVSGAIITLTPLNPGMPGSSIKSTNTATPVGPIGVSISPSSSETIGLPDFQNQFLAIQLFDKVAVLVRGLRLVATDLGWLISNSSVYGGLDLTQLPVTTSQPSLSLSPLLTTFLLVKLARMFSSAPPSSTVQTLYDVIGGASDGTLGTDAQVQTALASITGWPLADIEAFVPALGLSYPTSYTQPAVYDALRTLEAMSDAVSASGPAVTVASTTLSSAITAAQTSITVASDIGFPSPNFYISIGAEILLVTAVDGADNTTWTVQRGQQGTTSAAAASGAVVTPTYGVQIVSWGSVPVDEVSAESLAASALGTLKAQQPSDDAWLALAPTLMDPIREHRSSALQAYLINQRDGSGKLIYGDVDGLFDNLLIDTQMSSCQLTSRVVQAYITVQLFVERCLMNLEAPEVVVDLTKDDTWSQWEWMSRYRIWEANREVFLFPENWLIESQRPNRTEIYKKLEQEVHQGQSTSDYLETVVLNYVDRLDGIAHLLVTGTCEDPASGTIYVVARTPADPPTFYLRSYENGAWAGWEQIPLDIKAHLAIPALYRGRVCLFWPEVKLANEPSQQLSPPQQSSTPPSQNAERYVTIGVFFSIFRNGSWTPVQTSKGKLFDKPLMDSNSVSDTKTIESLYTLKVLSPAPSPGYGANLFVDVFRFGDYSVNVTSYSETVLGVVIASWTETSTDGPTTTAVQVGRAVFDGRFSDLELNGSIDIVVQGNEANLYEHAQSTYGPDADPLIPLTAPDPDLSGEPNLLPKAGAQVSQPAGLNAGSSPSLPLTFTSLNTLERNAGTLLNTAQVPFRIVGPDSDVNPGFDPTSYFFFQDNRRSYYVEAQKFYWTGSMFSPVTPSSPGSVPYEMRYHFHVFYHPFTRLFWNQLSGGGFDLFYDPEQQNPNKSLQQNPDQIDPSGADVFTFQSNYNPVIPPVWWDHDDVTGQDRQFLDYQYDAAYSVYNWELFYHIPIYIAQMLSQNLQFEDARTWFEYVFNPTRQSSDPVPQRFWIPKPLHDITSTLQEQINNLLEAVNHGDPSAVAQVEKWRNDPFNPFLLADLRNGVPYMKYTVMSYIDNLVSWGDNLFSTESREALSEATLLYEIASEILGPTPIAVTPPQHADESFDQLEPSLDAFANAMVEIENVIGGAGGSGTGGGSGDGGIPMPQTFYFKIPPNEKLLGYWNTIADRLYKLRHCETIAGAPLQLALFDAPIDPGLLIEAQAAGIDLTSVLSDLVAPLPNYRFTSLYPQASDFVNAVRTYGSSLQAALEKKDSGALALLQQTLAQQLLIDGNQILDWQVQSAQSDYDATNDSLTLATQKYTFNSSQWYANPGEIIDITLTATAGILKVIAAATATVGAVAASVPNFTVGAAGFGGTPVATINDGGGQLAQAGHMAGISLVQWADIASIGAGLARTLSSWQRRQDIWTENALEAKTQMDQATAQLNMKKLAIQIAQQNQILHQEQIDNAQQQIDFLNDKFTSDSLYDWMAGKLSQIYFQSYQLAYRMCKQVERCYQFELGIQDSSFIQFGYWDSLYKGLMAGETLNHDLRRMQASYLQQNARRYELSRYISLGLLDPGALQNLLVNGFCDFNIPESLFDNDYPGHYNRRLTRMSVTVVYPNPGKFDNVKATLTLVANKVRISTDTSSGYDENPVGSDTRFIYSYAANSQKIALGNAQDDPGLFVTTISSNISDQRYLPFENAGAISSWRLEMPQLNNEVDLSTVGDVVLHLYYTALYGGDGLRSAVEADNAANLPTSGVKVFSAQNDFVAPPPTVTNPYPESPWQAFLETPPPGSDQTLTLSISPNKFPPWTRGKTISISTLTVIALAWPTDGFVLEPQPPLPNADINMTLVTGATEPNVWAAPVTMPPNTPPGTWTFKLRTQTATDFHSLTKNAIGDVLLMVNYQVS